MNTDTTKRYRLKQKFTDPNGTVHAGVIKDAHQWMARFALLNESDLDIKTDWFEPVSELVHEKIKVHSVLWGSDFNKYGIRLYNISLNRNLIEGEGEKIKQAIESCLNEPLPQPSAPEPSALPTKEWEICALRDENGSLWYSDMMPKTGQSIAAVKRLSDNVVFSVREEVGSTWGKQMIIGFELSSDKRIIVNFPTCNNPLNKISKLPITDHPTQPVVEEKPVDNTEFLKQIQKWKDTYCEPLSEWSDEMVMEWKNSSLDIQQFIKSKIPTQ